MKKLLSVLMCAVLLAGVLLTSACGTAAPAATSTAPAATDKAEATSNPTEPAAGNGPYWLSDTPVKLSCLVMTRPMADDFDNNEFTKWFEPATNVDLEFVVVPENEAKNKLNIMLSSGDYPEVLLPQWLLSRVEVNYYGKQGIFIELNDLIDQYGVNTKKMFAQYPNAETYATLEGGKIYSVPAVTDTLHMSDTWKMWVYQPWLDKLNLKMPTTTAELVEVLTAFKTGDPNGNGKADEIPMAGCQKSWSASPNVFLMNAFTYDDGNERLWVENGKVDVNYNKNKFKEGLKFIKQLVDQGLLAKESFTQDQNALIQIAENPDVQILGFAFGGYEGVFSDLNATRWTDYAICPAVAGPDGTRLAQFNYNYSYNVGNQITDKCKNKEVAFKMLDLFYDREILLKRELGQEGRDWRRPKDGEEGYAGPAVYAPLVEYSTIPKNVIWDQNGVCFQDEAFRVGGVSDVKKNPMEKILFEGTRDMLKPYYPDMANLYPNVLQTDEETAELTTLTTDLVAYVNEMVARFVTGDVDIEAGWADYMAKLDSLKLGRYLELKQAIYDRNMK